MATGSVLMAAEDLKRLASDIFVARDFSPDHATTIAEVLIWANLRGVDSHGISRIPRYLEMVTEGNINPRPEFGIQSHTPSCFTFEADQAAGQIAMVAATEEAITRARQAGIAWGVVRATTHVGAIGYFPLISARSDMVGIAFSASVPMMAYHGAATFSAGTNPIAVAVPAASRAPLLLDMATAVASAGKITDARNRGQSIPDNWALDAEGRATTDPNEAKISLPLGGPKGAGLSMMFECLGSLLAGNPILSDVIGGPHPPPHRQNAVVVAIDISIFTDLDGFKANVDALAETLKSQPLSAETDEILMPGERGGRVLEQRTRDGIPLPAKVWEQLQQVAAERGVDAPEPLG